jgi:hypothetical protein
MNLEFLEETAAEKGFAEFYKKKIKPQVQNYEALRKAALWQCLSRLMIVSCAVVLFFIVQHGYSFRYRDEMIDIAFFLLAGFCFFICAPIFTFKTSVKEKIFSEVFSFFGDFKYFQEGSRSLNLYSNFNILPVADDFRTEDLVVGKYQDVAISIEELKLQNIHHSKNGVKKVTLFKGVVVLFSMNKNFKGRTNICHDRGKIRNFFHSKSKNHKGLERVTLEDPEFEKKFEVFASDQIESRYLLTTAFMDRLLKIVKLFGNSKLEAAFYDNSLFLVIPYRLNLFEPGSIFKATNYVKECKMIIAQMHLFFSIIETLKLNQRTGL